MLLRLMWALTAAVAVGSPAFAGEVTRAPDEVPGLVVAFRTDEAANVATRVAIRRDGKTVYEAAVTVSMQALGEDDLFPVPAGTDVTGDGSPDLVLQVFSGGAHCCFSYFVFALEPVVRRVLVLETLDAVATFTAPQGAGRSDIAVRDMTFEYWNAPYVDSPAPSVVLTFAGDNLVLDEAVMRKSPPSAHVLVDAAAKVKPLIANRNDRSPHFPLPSQLWATMLDLIYSGNGDLALAFLDQAWPATKPGKSEFLAAFRAQLVKSPYWRGIAALNGWSPQRPF
jgi:hypothetical protein